MLSIAGKTLRIKIYHIFDGIEQVTPHTIIKKTRLRRAFILTPKGEVVGCTYPGGKYATKLYFLTGEQITQDEELKTSS